MHEAYASYLGELLDYSTTMQSNEKLKERYAMPFSKWADSRSKKEFLCAYTDYSASVNKGPHKEAIRKAPQAFALLLKSDATAAWPFKSLPCAVATSMHSADTNAPT